jgi:hypothetical protein
MNPEWTPDGSPSYVHENDGETAWVMIRKGDVWCDAHDKFEYDYDTVEFTRPANVTVEQFRQDFPEGQPMSDKFLCKEIGDEEVTTEIEKLGG